MQHGNFVKTVHSDSDIGSHLELFPNYISSRTACHIEQTLGRRYYDIIVSFDIQDSSLATMMKIFSKNLIHPWRSGVAKIVLFHYILKIYKTASPHKVYIGFNRNMI